jgi:nucleoside-diphosphate-sugar epimerase/aryl carrier-like protein
LLLPSQRPFSADLIEQVLEDVKVTMLIAPPSILEELVASPSGLQRLQQAKLKLIMYGGGPLAKKTGDVLAKIAPLTSFLGSTETGVFPTYVPPPEDWYAFRFHPDLHPPMDHIGGDLFEIVLSRDGTFEAVYTHFPHLSEYRTRDLYRPHDRRPGWWVYHGRVDDLIVLSNGEKVDPAAMEAAVKSHPYVRDSLVVGQGRFQPALLVELQEDVTDLIERNTVFQSVWEVVKDANRLLPGQSQIARQFIRLALPHRPFARSGKGSVQRQLTIQNYVDVLDELYETAEYISGDTPLESLNETGTKKDIEDVVRAVIHEAFSHQELKDDIDLFYLGMDSLQVLQCLRRLRGISRQLAGLTVNVIYANPSILRLSDAIAEIIQGRGDSVSNHLKDLSDHAAQMQQLVTKYSADLPCMPSDLDSFANELTVVLTGSTGSLGCHLLDSLVDITKIRRIICLNRSAGGSSRQQQVSASRGLRTDWATPLGSERATTIPVVEFWKTDLSRVDLGLSEVQLSELTSAATHFIHNAWHVNYNERLESFEQVHIAGLRHLIDLVAKCRPRPVVFLFISSVATVARWATRHEEPVEDEIIDDSTAAAPMGYAESKYVAERIVANAASAFGLAARFAVLRVGQISGPGADRKIMKNGMSETREMAPLSSVKVLRWNKREWFPSLVISSKHLGLLCPAWTRLIGSLLMA